ncbi:MAG: FAD-dependent oxidoreductase [Planctomycetota bacterium]|jgi:heterodisulfide reductase subunit A-like polyferredoxin
MQASEAGNGRIGAALVVGGGIGGMQAALDLAASGIKVHLVDANPSIGGKMSQLDKTFPTNDCAMCTMGPRLVEVGRNRDIDVITLSEIERIEGEAGNFRVTLRKRARYVDIAKCLGCGACAEVCPVRIPDEHNLRINETAAVLRSYPQAVPNSYSIQRRGEAPCRHACPIGQKAQGYIALIRQRRFEDAFHVIVRENPFPSVCGRVCKAYCEEECTRRRVDGPVSIRDLKKFVADRAFEDKLARRELDAAEEGARKASKRVAIVGSGPAGLTAARDLRDRGHSVTVFEALPRAGGMMWAGIPDFRLPREHLDWDIENILATGIDLRVGHRVESIDALLRDGFDAVFVAIGMHVGKKPPIAGHDLPDVLVGTDFLREAALGRDLRVKARVLVLGGGDVAMDVARTALRRGAKEVSIVCLESRANMPADPLEVEMAEREGAVLFPSRSGLEITSSDGAVTGLRCFRVAFRGFDADGAPDMDVFGGTEHVIDADTVVFAVGQTSETPFAAEGIELTKGGAIRVDPDTLATTKPGVFAGGDVVTGTSFIVDAIAAGHRAARSIDLYLDGQELERLDRRSSVAVLTDEEIAAKAGIRAVLSHREGSPGLTEAWAVAEAERCLECGICSECSLCEEACEAGAIDLSMPSEELAEIEVGALVLTPGYSVFDAGSKPELGYGRYPNVVTSLEFERMLSASGPSSGEVRRPSDRKAPKRIAFLQCVGSRDSKRDLCSSVCCMAATKQALLAKEHAEDGLDCDIFFMDLRAFGKHYDQFYQRAQMAGVNYVRCRPPAVREIPESRNLGIDYLVKEDRKVRGEYDLVVLSVGLQPPPGAVELAEKTGVSLNDLNFCRTPAFRPAESGRKGIYVAGAFTEPKDIPETVMQASAAASRVLSDLTAEKFSLIARKEYPPETDTAGQDPRVGVFVCHCGRNIAGVVDVQEVVEYAKSLPDVVHAESNLYACSNDVQELIKERIEELGLNRVVVASCTPRTHEALFRDTIREGRLNPYLFEMANIRDQCAWVHRDLPEQATKKAKSLVSMAVAKARLDEPLRKRSIQVNRAALVIGGGLAGMTCANELAAQGFDVFLLERQKELGGQLRRVRFLVGGADPQAELQRVIERTRANERIQLFLESRLETIEGSVGDFTSRISRNGETTKLKHGVVIVATGAREHAPKEHLYGEDDRIVTQLELEARLAQGGDWLAAGRKKRPKTVVMIQCVGSRNEERPYCSRICCTEAVKNALKIKELSPETHVYVLYRDIRVYGFKERFYTQARRNNVVFLRFDDDRNPVVARNGSGLEVEVFDPVLETPITIAADLVVLSAGIVRYEENVKTAQQLKVPLGRNEFFLEAHLKLRPVDFATGGVFLCGLAHASKSVEESVSQAQAAAARASAILSKDTLELEANISQVEYDSCDGCGYCVDPCPANAISLVEFMSKGAVKKAVEVAEIACLGCGSCQATCPKAGIRVRGFTLDQLHAQVAAALEMT